MPHAHFAWLAYEFDDLLQESDEVKRFLADRTVNGRARVASVVVVVCDVVYCG